MSTWKAASLLFPLGLLTYLFAQGLDTPASKDDWEEINFEFNSSVLVDGFPSLLRLAELLDQHPGFFARDLLPSEPTHAQRVALHRAMCTLQAQREIAVARWLGRHPSGGKLVIFRYGERAPHPNAIARIEH